MDAVYITVDDLQKRYSASDLSSYAPEALAAAVADANGLVDSYIPDVYPRPLPSIPGVLAAAACDIARLRLFQEEAPDTIQKRHDTALKYLQDIAAGKAALPGAMDTTAPESLILFQCNDSRMSVNDLRCW